MNSEIKNICDEVDKLTKKECISFDISKEKCSIFNSKLGGIPYMMMEENELCFLAQINFEELPTLQGFPEKGIIQFFIYDNENEMWGAGDVKRYKIVYYENVNYKFDKKYNDIVQSDNFPVQDEYRLRGSKKLSKITVNDYRFNEVFMKVYKKYFATEAKGYWEIPSINENEIIQYFSAREIRCGGNPEFIQDDIREYNIELKNSVLLFEIPSIIKNDISVCWGDSGIANFFIKEEDLANRKFNGTYFYWDCY